MPPLAAVSRALTTAALAALIAPSVGSAAEAPPAALQPFAPAPHLTITASGWSRPRAAPAPLVWFLPRPQPYAYGWFGAGPRRHGSVHYGYYRNYIQWKSR